MMERRDRFYILMWSVAVFMLLSAYMLVPESQAEYKMFHFSNVLISKQAYWDYIFRCISYIVIFHVLSYAIPSMRGYFTIYFVLWCGYLIDYYLCYNEPFTHIGLFPISYSLFAWLIMVSVVFYDIFRK